MNHTSYSDRVSAEIRKANQQDWANSTVAARKFTHPTYQTEKTIYCMKGIRNAAFTITDGTTCIIRDCQTIEDARKQFKSIQDDFLARGYHYKAAA